MVSAEANSAIQFLFPGIAYIHEYLIANDGTITKWTRQEAQPTPEQIAAAVLPAAKAQRIKRINADCRARLIARYGDATEQVSRSLGIYGATEKAAMEAGIAATIDASNTASNAVLAATTAAEVEAVTVQWPVI